MNYFELYPGDYLWDTGRPLIAYRLSLIEHGAYLKLLLDYYVTVQPLPADWKDLYIIVCAITAAEKGLQFGVIQSLAR
ncbi:DUF1376 domain-containing protein [Xylella fastidiosa]|uniref:DUF1376 domain-containing protein n=1 Tax=Xylella fastidiosa TaxID=2371 RepID=UPI000766154B|nr:DUF1376 domain-containing protein [Xylella fastidiosa]KXB12901.1 hypothetical protein ADT33_08790 [Xylella fastidiosa]TNW22729.1 DUF1376 domain-containing protein [Xylella fastidiosa subsp. pauca]